MFEKLAADTPRIGAAALPHQPPFRSNVQCEKPCLSVFDSDRAWIIQLTLTASSDALMLIGGDCAAAVMRILIRPAFSTPASNRADHTGKSPFLPQNSGGAISKSPPTSYNFRETGTARLYMVSHTFLMSRALMKIHVQWCRECQTTCHSGRSTCPRCTTSYPQCKPHSNVEIIAQRDIIPSIEETTIRRFPKMHGWWFPAAITSV